jgi:hypothetical protein
MDERKWRPGWREWALIIALVVAVVMLALILLGPQYAVIYQRGGGQPLAPHRWLVVGIGD